MEKNDPNIKSRPFPKEEPENEKQKDKPKGAFMEALGRIGYSVWIIVMIVGGVLAFLLSLLLV